MRAGIALGVGTAAKLYPLLACSRSQRRIGGEARSDGSEGSIMSTLATRSS